MNHPIKKKRNQASEQEVNKIFILNYITYGKMERLKKEK